MDPKLRDEYKRLRAKHPHYEAKTCLAIARDRLKYRSLPDEWEQDGFEIEVSSDYDEYCSLGDLDFMGRFDSSPGYKEYDRAIDRWARDYGRRNDGRIPRWYFEDPYHCLGGNGREYRYVIPEADYEGERRSWLEAKVGRSEADRRARETVAQQVEALETYGESWWMVNVDVKVSREGVVLGRASIGGVEQGLGDDEPLRMIAEEHGLVDEALREAEDMLERLCLGRAS
jgi:hypothetical protein